MGTQYCISTGPISLVQATAKTCIELPTSATAGLTVVGVEFSFALPTAGSVGSCVVEWLTWATTGAGPTVTPLLMGTGQGVVANVGTVRVDNTGEPGTLASGGLPSWIVPLPGMFSILYAQSREFFQPASTNRCLRLTSTLAPVGTATVRIDLYFEQ